METLLNCTPHAVTILSPDCCEYDARTRSYKLTGEPVVLRTIPPCGICPRCTSEESQCDPLDGVPTVVVTFGDIENMPPQRDGVYLIVSAIVRNAADRIGRTDTLVPSRVVRDAEGRIVGCLALAW